MLIQPPGEPQEQHLGDVPTQKDRATQNFIKDKMTGRVDICILAHFLEIKKI